MVTIAEENEKADRNHVKRVISKMTEVSFDLYSMRHFMQIKYAFSFLFLSVIVIIIHILVTYMKAVRNKSSAS